MRTRAPRAARGPPRPPLTPPPPPPPGPRCAARAQNKSPKTADDEAQIKALYKKFGVWHGISSLNNLGVLAATVAYGWIVAGKLASPL